MLLQPGSYLLEGFGVELAKNGLLSCAEDFDGMLWRNLVDYDSQFVHIGLARSQNSRYRSFIFARGTRGVGAVG